MSSCQIVTVVLPTRLRLPNRRGSTSQKADNENVLRVPRDEGLRNREFLLSHWGLGLKAALNREVGV